MKQCPECFDLFKDEAEECPKCHCMLEADDPDYTAEATGRSTVKSRLETYFVVTAFDKALFFLNAGAAVLFILSVIMHGFDKILLILSAVSAVVALLCIFKGYVYEFQNFAAGDHDGMIPVNSEARERMYRIKSRRSSHLAESGYFIKRVRLIASGWAICTVPAAFAAFFGG